jgi:hypothetical protein
MRLVLGGGHRVLGILGAYGGAICSECSPLRRPFEGVANPAEGPWRREARQIVSRRNPTPATSVRSRAERSTFRLSPRKQKVDSRGGPK